MVMMMALNLQKGKAWTTQLLAVACLSLAAKMEETEVPLSLDLQVCPCWLEIMGQCLHFPSFFGFQNSLFCFF